MTISTEDLRKQTDSMVKDRADWLVDAVACATQNRMFLRGEDECDDVACDAIQMNGAKALRHVMDNHPELIDARAELAQARAEAQAAVARGMELAAEILAVRADVLLVDAGADAELVRVLDASVAAIRNMVSKAQSGSLEF